MNRMFVCIVLLLTGCTTVGNQISPLECSQNIPVKFKGQIKKLDHIKGEIWVNGEYWHGVASNVDLKVFELYSGECTGNFAQVKLTESSPGYLNVGTKLYIYVDKPSDLGEMPFARWSFEDDK